MDNISLNPFDKVLVRDRGYEAWQPDIFLFINEETTPFKYNCSKQNWKYCIKYEGNEELIGTSNDIYKDYNFTTGEVGMFSHDGKTWRIAFYVCKEGQYYITTETIKNNRMCTDEEFINSFKFAKPYKQE